MQGGDGGTDGEATHRAAAHGTSGASGQLPFIEQIQPLFGDHDVSSVQAHTGRAASEGASAMGAEAYAVGDQVAFGRTPTLHTAAHEAAHVVQQRAGVALKGGVGQAGDPYELHADAVADAVVRGESVVGLLGGYGGGGGSGAVRAVQRFAPPHHEQATIDGLQDAFNPHEIGQIYQANWERDFSQGPLPIAQVVMAWKELKLTAGQEGTNARSSALRTFNGAIGACNDLIVRLKSAAWAVLEENLTGFPAPKLDHLLECMGGYEPWEHMDRPDSARSADANRRWASTGEKLPGYIADGKANIKDELCMAAQVYWGTFAGFEHSATMGLDNWQGAKPPPGYDPPFHGDGLHGQAKAVADTTERTAGKRPSMVRPLARPDLFERSASHLGRANHVLEDFFAHSNWVDLALHIKSAPGDGRGCPPDVLRTGTFPGASKIEALSHKLDALAGALETATKDTGLDLPADTIAVLTTGLKILSPLLVRIGRRMGGAGEHQDIAKDDPGSGAFEEAVRVATAADRFVIAPMRQVLAARDGLDDDLDPEAMTKLGQSLLVPILTRVDQVIAPPTADHPLWKEIPPARR